MLLFFSVTVPIGRFSSLPASCQRTHVMQFVLRIAVFLVKG